MKTKLLIVLSLVITVNAHAGGAAWKLNPTDNNWNNASNWTPSTVPNGSADVATFGASSLTTVLLDVSLYHPLAELVFKPGASGFTFNVTGDILVLGGAGITNSSGTIQTFAIFEGQSIGFHSNATAGDQTNFTLAPSAPFVPGVVFYDAATAGSATYTINGSATGDVGAELQFIGLSSAAEGLFSNLGGNGAGSQGGFITFYDSAKGGNGTFTNEGGVGSGALGGAIVFADTSDAENATLIAHGGVAGGRGATIKFLTTSAGGDARVELFGNGLLTLATHDLPSLSIGSLEGDGLVLLGPGNLVVGSNNLSTVFSGIIQDTGSLTKTGTGTLTLSNVNTYTGGTTLKEGTLLAKTSQGSATGPGLMQVNAGTFGGRSNIAGAVTIGDGSSARAF